MKTVSSKNPAIAAREKELVNVMQTGNDRQAQAAFNELYTIRQEGLLNWISVHLRGNKDIAEDIMQETFMKAFTKILSFNPEYAFSTWLYKIAQNCIIDHLRKQNIDVISYDGMRPNISHSDHLEGFNDGNYSFLANNEDSHKVLIRKQNRQIIQEAIEQLGEGRSNVRKVMQMKYLEDMSNITIARQLNMPLGSVKATGFRGEGMIKKYLKEKGFEYTN